MGLRKESKPKAKTEKAPKLKAACEGRKNRAGVNRAPNGSPKVFLIVHREKFLRLTYTYLLTLYIKVFYNYFIYLKDSTALC